MGNFFVKINSPPLNETYGSRNVVSSSIRGGVFGAKADVNERSSGAPDKPPSERKTLDGTAVHVQLSARRYRAITRPKAVVNSRGGQVTREAVIGVPVAPGAGAVLPEPGFRVAKRTCPTRKLREIVFIVNTSYAMKPHQIYMRILGVLSGCNNQRR